jgi:IS5 family transposase
VLRTKVDPQPSLFEAILPEEYRRLPPGLAAVDELLDDPVFFEPFVPFFDPTQGRPSIPIETYLRLMYLRFRYHLGFETLCAEVTDSLSWRRFCRIGPYGRVPNPSTLMKITTRCGEKAVAGLNAALLEKADAAKLVRLDKVRVDTTVVEANVAYPTDSGLLAKGVAKLARTVRALRALGLGAEAAFRDRTRSVRRRAHAIGAWLRRRTDEARGEVLGLTGELAGIAGASLADARALASAVRKQAVASGAVLSGRAKSLLAELERTADVLEQVVGQTRSRLSGAMPDGSTRVVSLHDTDARPIAKGRLGRPVEFGYKVQLADNAAGIVLDYSVHQGNPADAGLIVPAVRRLAARFRRAPLSVTADRGYGEAAVEEALRDAGVREVAILRKGRPGASRRALESSRRFRSLVKWRTGCEGRISHLKHGYLMERTLIDGAEGVGTWCGWSVLAHNSTKVALLAREQLPRGWPSRARPSPTRPPPASSEVAEC